MLEPSVGHEQQDGAVFANTHSRAIVALRDEGAIIAHVLQRVVPDEQRSGGHDVRVGEHVLPMSGRVGFEDDNAVAAQTERAVLVVFAVHRVLAGRVLPEVHAVDAQITNGKVLVHVEKGAVKRRHRIVLECHFRGFRAPRFMRECQCIVRSIRDFQNNNLLIRGEELFFVEQTLMQHHSVQGVGFPVAIHESKRISLSLQAERKSEKKYNNIYMSLHSPIISSSLQRLHHTLYILIRRIPRSNQSNLVGCLVPVIEEGGLCEAVGDGAWESEQQDVAVSGLGEDVAAQFRDALTKLLCLRVGVGGVLLPEIVLEIGDELGAEVAHFRAELGALLAVVLELGHQRGVQHHDRFAHQHPVLGAPEADDINAAVGGHLFEALAEFHRGVGNAGTVKMQVHAERMDEVGDGADLLAGVGRAEFRTLGDIDGFGLRMVLEAPVGEVRLNELWGQFAIGRGNGN